MKITNNHVFFWKEFLSQWTMDSFTELGVQFNCCEQYMMWRKALLFKDYKTAEKIINAPEPYRIKQLGREVGNFNGATWDAHKYNIVVEANYLRFTQNPHSKIKLLKFDKNVTFVEASPFDKVWGIGVDENYPGIENPDRWKGENLLGKALTEVRDLLLDEEEPK